MQDKRKLGDFPILILLPLAKAAVWPQPRELARGADSGVGWGSNALGVEGWGGHGK